MKAKINSRTVFHIGLFLFFVFSFLADTIPGGNAVIVVSILLMIVSWVMRERDLRFVKRDMLLLLWLVVFTIYICASRLWAENPSMTISKSNAMMFLVIAMLAILLCKYWELRPDTILKVIMFGGYAVGLYILARTGIRGVFSLIENEKRLGSLLNANTLGMCIAYSLLINFYFILYDKKLRFLDLLMIPMLVILIATGSRKAILIVIGGIFALIILKSFNNRKALISLLRVILVVLLLSVITYLVLQLPMMSKLKYRLNDMIIALRGEGTRGTDGWLRIQYVKLGMELFRKHPILGIGLGNANTYTLQLYNHNHYLHNNYVEMLATLGIVGTVLYYSIYAYFLYAFFKYRKVGRDREYDVCLTILLVRLVMDYGAVFFYNKETYIYILLFWIETERLRAKARNGVSGTIPDLPDAVQ